MHIFYESIWFYISVFQNIYHTSYKVLAYYVNIYIFSILVSMECIFFWLWMTCLWCFFHRPNVLYCMLEKKGCMVNFLRICLFALFLLDDFFIIVYLRSRVTKRKRYTKTTSIQGLTFQMLIEARPLLGWNQEVRISFESPIIFGKALEFRPSSGTFPGILSKSCIRNGRLRLHAGTPRCMCACK